MTGAWSEGPVPPTGVAIHDRPRDTLGDRPRAEHEIDALPRCWWKSPAR